jgi:hypothetical protein
LQSFDHGRGRWVFIRSNQKATQRGGFGMSDVMVRVQVITVG